MATSVIEICNNALQDLKADVITSLTDGSENARLCNQRWPQVRDFVLAEHPWNCAMTQAELAASSTAPTWKWDYAYPLPSACLRVFEVVSATEDPITSYEVQGREILCNEPGPIFISYVRREEDPTKYDAQLCEALSAALAARLVYPITASVTGQQAWTTLYENILAKARGVDARQGSAPESTDRGSWHYARLGGRS